jgi:chitinase
MKNKITCLTLFLLLGIFAKAQNPNPALVGYWQNWYSANAPYIQLNQIDPRYNIIDVAFAIPHVGTDYQMEFIPDQVTPAVLISQIQTLQSQGKKVIISIGGATAPVSLDNITERDTFISTMNSIISTYGFDGIDIDLEGGSVSTSGGTIATPTDAKIINLIYAVKQIMADYYASNNKRLILTMAPETAFVQGGMSAYGGIWGAYLPVIHALRDSIEILHVQLYNSGSMYGIDGGIYTQGTADFIVAMTEAVIQGFSTGGGMFTGLSADKIAVGLPACTNAAGGGFTDTATVASALRYLMGTGPKPGTYSLVQTGGYPNLRGMMTWSINWDAVSTCASVYEYAENFSTIFGITTSTQNWIAEKVNVEIFPNPSRGNFYVYVADNTSKEKNYKYKLIDLSGRIIKQGNLNKQKIEFKSAAKGMYQLQIYNNESFYSEKIIVSG